MILGPIGFVHNQVAGAKYEGWEEVISEIAIEPEWEGALAGIEEFSHLEVIFWLSAAERPGPLRIHPRDREDLPLVGFLATRTPNRPNPLGLTVVRLLERKGRRLRVQGLDAFDGTPVIDVKPFQPYDRGEVRLPDWVRRLRGEVRR